jgi:hypothetical protein
MEVAGRFLCVGVAQGEVGRRLLHSGEGAVSEEEEEVLDHWQCMNYMQHKRE